MGTEAGPITIFFFLALSGLVARPILSLVQRAVSFSLYSRRRDYGDLLRELQRDLRSTFDSVLLVEKILAILCDKARMGTAALVLKGQGLSFEVRGERGIPVRSDGSCFPEGEPFFEFLAMTRKTVAREESAGRLLSGNLASQMAGVMELLPAQLVVPMVWGDQLQGGIAAGRGVGGAPFRIEDYEFVEAVTALAGVAMENALLF